MKTILYATDYSENSAPALHFSYALSKELNAELMALHVFELPLTLASTVSFTYSRKEVRALGAHREKLIAFCTQHLRKEPEPLKITWKIDEGKPASEVIVKNAKELKADLIVVGTKGGSPIRKALLGSNTTALINSAPCPVLAVPEDADFHGFKKIVYATDFEGADIFTIEKMVELAKPFEADVHLVHVSTEERETGEDQMAWFKNMLRHKVDYKNLRFDLRYGEDIFESLQKYVAEIEPDMVAMLERENNSLIKNLRHYDLVKRMKSKGHVPLLSYPKRNVGE
ncbi:MAG TPA: universal stress protein [Pricia sp.]|nr:universal stress protein [Pricia sp.]